MREKSQTFILFIGSAHKGRPHFFVSEKNLKNSLFIFIKQVLQKFVIGSKVFHMGFSSSKVLSLISQILLLVLEFSCENSLNILYSTYSSKRCSKNSLLSVVCSTLSKVFLCHLGLSSSKGLILISQIPFLGLEFSATLTFKSVICNSF